MGTDDLELLNALGQQRGEKKENCTYGSIASLPQKMRFEHGNMAILCIVDQKVLVGCDPVRVFAGADPKTGDFIDGDWASLGAQFRAGIDGILVRDVRAPHNMLAVLHPLILTRVLTEYHAVLPHDAQVPLTEDDSVTEDIELFIALVGASCDYLMKTMFGPNMMSTHAWKYCDMCDMDKRDDAYGKPFSFMEGCGAAPIGACAADAAAGGACAPQAAPSRTCRWKLRTLQGMLATLDHAWESGLNQTQRKLYLREAGYRVKGVLGVCALHIAASRLAASPRRPRIAASHRRLVSPPRIVAPSHRCLVSPSHIVAASHRRLVSPLVSWPPRIAAEYHRLASWPPRITSHRHLASSPRIATSHRHLASPPRIAAALHHGRRSVVPTHVPMHVGCLCVIADGRRNILHCIRNSFLGLTTRR